MAFRPICVPCRTEMRCKKNDYLFSDFDGRSVWASDMYECPACKTQVLTGYSREAVAQEHESSFASYRAESQFDIVR